MAFIQCTQVSLSFGDRDILKNVNLYLKSGSKAALCGANGAGKTTLLNVLAGSIAPDSGERVLEKGCRAAYLPQAGIVCAGKTLYEEAESVFEPWRALQEKTQSLRRELAALREGGLEPVPEAPGAEAPAFLSLAGSAALSPRGRALVAEHNALFDQLEASGYLLREKDIYRVTGGLGFRRADLTRRCEEFSGGWQMRIALAKTLLQKSPILMLDEPTNYLDIEARSYLLERLKQFEGALLIVSHDRHFLDSLITEVFELFNGTLTRYTGNYSVYEKTRAADEARLRAQHKAQGGEIERLQSLADRFRYKAGKAAFAQEQLKKIKKIERVQLPEQLKKIRLAFAAPPPSGRVALTIKRLSKAYGSLRVFEPFDLTLEAGERLLCVGPNGSGKSTLLRILAGEERASGGKVCAGAGVSAGYFSQDAAERLRGSLSVLDYLASLAGKETRARLRDMLGAFLFSGDDVEKPLDVLSGGEKSRLALLELLLQPHNLLILDEPTNHLDIYSKDALLAALQSWKGACVFVSHDRVFMERLSGKTLELRHGESPRYFAGNYRYYMEKTAAEAAAAGEEGRAAKKAVRGAFIESEAALSRQLKKSAQAEERRRERQEEALIAAIAALEAEKAALEAESATPEVYLSAEAVRAVRARLAAIAAEIAGREAAWEGL